MDHTYIIKKPMITEKSTVESDEHNRFCFEVDLHANKKQIKDAIEFLYNVKVEKVSTQVRKGEYRRTRRGMQQKTSWKKAVVQLQGDHKIELF